MSTEEGKRDWETGHAHTLWVYRVRRDRRQTEVTEFQVPGDENRMHVEKQHLMSPPHKPIHRIQIAARLTS